MLGRWLLFPSCTVALGQCFFAPVVVDYLFGGISAVRPTIADVPDEKLQLKIKQV